MGVVKMKIETDIIGQKVIAVRPMTDAEKQKEGWYEGATVIVFESGVCLYPSQKCGLKEV